MKPCRAGLGWKLGIEKPRPVRCAGLVDPAAGIPYSPDRNTGPLWRWQRPQVGGDDVVIALQATLYIKADPKYDTLKHTAVNIALPLQGEQQRAPSITDWGRQ